MQGCNTKGNALIKQLEMHACKMELMFAKAKECIDTASFNEREQPVKLAKALVDDGRSTITIQTLIALLRTPYMRTAGSQQKVLLRDVLKTYETPIVPLPQC